MPRLRLWLFHAGATLRRPLLLRLPLTPEAENAFPYPEKAQAVEGNAKDVEVPQEYRIAHREPNGDQDNACNYAFHISIKISWMKKQFLCHLRVRGQLH
jgi:hypothetical protein